MRLMLGATALCILTTAGQAASVPPAIEARIVGDGVACMVAPGQALAPYVPTVLGIDAPTYVWLADGDCPVSVRFYWTPSADHISVVFERQPENVMDGRDDGLIYRAVVTLDGKTICDEQVGDDAIVYRKAPLRHRNGQRWRCQNKPMPVRVSIAELVAKRLLPPLGLPAAWNFAGKPGSAYDQPLSDGGIERGMPGTGGRPDIGLFMGPSAVWAALALNTPQSPDLPGWEAAMRGNAEGAASIPWHVRDPKTGASLRFDGAYADVTLGWPGRSSQGRQLILAKDGWEPDPAHFPAPSIIPFLVTGDLYFLEHVQDEAAWAIGNYPADYRGREKMILSGAQIRNYAWSLRSVFQAMQTAPDDPTGYLVARSYYKKVLDNNAAWWAQRIEANELSTRVGLPVLGSGNPPAFKAWMRGFLSVVVGTMVWAGEEQYRPLLQTIYDRSIVPFLALGPRRASAYVHAFGEYIDEVTGPMSMATALKVLNDVAAADENDKTPNAPLTAWRDYQDTAMAELDYMALAGLDVEASRAIWRAELSRFPDARRKPWGVLETRGRY
ncbi:MAG: hypothetical protein ACOY99_12265 [Pseudomonadota bacterium]